MYGALQHSLGAPLHRSFLPLNLHSARVHHYRASGLVQVVVSKAR